MQFNQTEIKDLTAVITLTVEPADYQEAVQKELIQIRKKANIPGFRPGMAPKGMLQKMYGKSILAEVINKVIGEGLNKYIEEHNLNLLHTLSERIRVCSHPDPLTSILTYQNHLMTSNIIMAIAQRVTRIGTFNPKGILLHRHTEHCMIHLSDRVEILERASEDIWDDTIVYGEDIYIKCEVKK